MNKKLTGGFILAVMLLSVITPFIKFPGVSGATLFSDGFESGDTSAWSGTSGSPTVVGGPVHSGSYLCEIAQPTDSDEYVSESLGSSYSTLFTRTYANYSLIPSGYLDTIILFRDNANGVTQAFAGVRNDGGTYYWTIAYRPSGGGYSQFTSATPLNLDQWYSVELKAIIDNGGSGEVRLYIGGSEIVDLTKTGLTFDTYNIDTVYVGQKAVINFPGGAYTLNVDDVIIADAYIGPIGGGGDSTSPTWSDADFNTTVAGEKSNLTITLNDETGLDFCIFSLDNGTGTYINGTWIDISGTEYNFSTVQRLNTSLNSHIRWKVYFNDTSNNWNSSYSNFYTSFVWDTCNSTALWTGDGTNPISSDAGDKVEGNASLQVIFIKDEWGGMIYKEPATGYFNFSETPLLRMKMKVNTTVPAGSDFILYFVTGPNSEWNIYQYNLSSQVTVGEWVTISIDLRLPDVGVSGKIPDLETGSQLAVVCTGAKLTSNFAVNFDYITLENGLVITPQIQVSPTIWAMMINENKNFTIRTLGGVDPITNQWYVNDAPQIDETEISFNFTIGVSGVYVINCTVTDSIGQINSIALNVTVLDPPIPPNLIPDSYDYYKSEIRAAFLHMWWSDSCDWDLVAQTCFNYSINTAIIELYKTDVFDGKNDVNCTGLHEAIVAFHNYNIKVTVLLVVAYGTYSGTEVLTVSGNEDWLDFAQPDAVANLTSVVTTLARDYNIDGFMYDYMRWNGINKPLGSDAETTFKTWLGVNVTWPDDILSGGTYYWNFTVWRAQVISDVVNSTSIVLKTYKPNLEIWASVFPAFDGCGNYQITYLGQATADWVDNNYVDIISPMLYEISAEDNGDELLDTLNFFVGGDEGKVPVVPFLTIYDGNDPYTTTKFVNDVERIQANGSDGWIIWCYGGPGFLPSSFFDVRPYLASLIANNLTSALWAMGNVTINGNNVTGVTVTWTTTVNSTCGVEYKNGEIYPATLHYGDFGRNFTYKDIDYSAGTRIENTTLSMSHSVSIPSGQIEYKFWSVANGVNITSEVNLVTLSGGGGGGWSQIIISVSTPSKIMGIAIADISNVNNVP